MMSRGVDHRQHVAELVEICQVLQRRVPSHVLKISQIWCTGHWYKNTMVLTKRQRVCCISSVICECFWDSCYQFTYEVAIQENYFVHNLCTRVFPICQCDFITKMHAYVFENIHGCSVDLSDLVRCHRFCKGKFSFQSRKHFYVSSLP